MFENPDLLSSMVSLLTLPVTVTFSAFEDANGSEELLPLPGSASLIYKIVHQGGTGSPVTLSKQPQKKRSGTKRIQRAS